jgi:hypothetical protein
MPAGSERPLTAAQKANHAYMDALQRLGRDHPNTVAARDKALSLPQRSPRDSRIKVKPLNK